MIFVEQVSKQFGSKALFEDVSFHLRPGEKVGLVGENGTGKTTFFKAARDLSGTPWLILLCALSAFPSPTREGPRPTHSGPQGRVYRESQLDECSVSLSLRTERESRQETERRKKERRERDRQRDSLPETLPCVFSKRSRVCRQNARVLCDTGVLTAHSGAF